MGMTKENHQHHQSNQSNHTNEEAQKEDVLSDNNADEDKDAVHAALLLRAPSEGGGDEHPVTRMNAFANLTNCILDAGILGVPYVLAQAGFAGGLLLIAFAAVISCYTIELLINVSHRACESGLIGCVAFEEVAELAGGPRMRSAVLVTQFVYCAGALV